MELGRIDVDEQRAQLADAVAGLGRGRAQVAVVRRGRALGRGRQRVGHARQVLDHSVVEVPCDPPALDVGGVDGAPEQLLALLLAALQPPREPPRERKLDQREQDQRADHAPARTAGRSAPRAPR